VPRNAEQSEATRVSDKMLRHQVDLDMRHSLDAASLHTVRMTQHTHNLLRRPQIEDIVRTPDSLDLHISYL
jgi:hypothetical protein